MTICQMPGCARPTVLAEAKGYSQFYCRQHIQFRSRHGSLWHPTYLASELRPYFETSSRWIAEHRGDVYVEHAITALVASLFGAGHAEPATSLRGLPAHKRARVALARLREAKIRPERLLAISLAVAGLIRQDAGSHHDSQEFRIVQVAKAAHRLASGWHKTWERPLDDGRTATITVHAYARSTGRVLRLMGAEIEKACEHVAARHLDDILALKNDLYGKHPSADPAKTGWKPLWRIKLDKQRAALR